MDTRGILCSICAEHDGTGTAVVHIVAHVPGEKIEDPDKIEETWLCQDHYRRYRNLMRME